MFQTKPNTVDSLNTCNDGVASLKVLTRLFKQENLRSEVFMLNLVVTLSRQTPQHSIIDHVGIVSQHNQTEHKYRATQIHNVALK